MNILIINKRRSLILKQILRNSYEKISVIDGDIIHIIDVNVRL